MLVSILALWKKLWYFLIPPSGQASGSISFWKMQSPSLGIQSFETVNTNFGYFGQHTSSMKTLWVLCDATFRLNKVLEIPVPRPWHPGFSSCKHEFWVFQHTSSKTKLWALFDTTFRASFRLNKVLKNLVLRPWHPEFWSCWHKFGVFV